MLLYALHRQYGVDFDLDSTGEQLNAMLGETDNAAAQIEQAYRVLSDLVRRQGLSVELEERTLAGIFSFEKLPMVYDLRSSAELLAQHDVIAAAAGAPPRSRRCNRRQPNTGPPALTTSHRTTSSSCSTRTPHSTRPSWLCSTGSTW